MPILIFEQEKWGGGDKKIRYMLFKIVILLMLKVKKKLFDGIHLSTAKSKGPARYHYATHITF